MDEVQKLIMQVEGQEKLDRLNTVLKQESEDLRQLVISLRAGAISQAQFDATSVGMASNVLSLNRQIKELSASTGSAGLGRSVLQAQYAIDDFVAVISQGGANSFQRAIASMQNNVPQIALAMGAGGGLAGAIGLTTIALGACIPVLTKWWQGATDAGEAGAFAAEKAKDAAKAFLALSAAKNKSEGKGSGLIHDQFVEAGVEKVRKGYLDTLLASGRGATEMPGETEVNAADKWEAVFRMARGDEYIPETQLAKIRTQKRIDEENTKRVSDMMLAASGGGEFSHTQRANARDSALAMATQFPASFEPDFAGNLNRAMPENLKQAEIINEQQRQAGVETAQTLHQMHLKDVETKKKAELEKEKAAATAHVASQRFAEEQRIEREAERQRQHDAVEARQAEARRPAEAKERELNEVGREIRGRSWASGAGLSDEQIMSAARESINMNKAGLDADSAINSAMMAQIENMQRLTQRYQQQAARASRLQMGMDNSSNFSGLEPLW